MSELLIAEKDFPIMADDIKIFLSAVTMEFEPQDKTNGIAYRSRLRSDCERPNVTLKIEEDFMMSGCPTLDFLDDYIKTCDAVVHLVGDSTGAITKRAEVESIARRYPDLLDRLPGLRGTIETGFPELSYTQWEAYLAVYHRMKEIHRPMLIIAKASELAPCGIEVAVDDPQRQSQREHLLRLENLGYYVGVTFENVDQLAAQVMRALFDIIPPNPLGKPNNLPLATLGSLFKGRDAFLETLRQKLQRGERASAIIGTQAVHGLGGLGKTRAAVEYGLRHADEYSALLFVAADHEALEKNLAELCGPLVLDLPEQTETDQAKRYAAVVSWLNKNPGWFLILDNVDDDRAAAAVEGLLPRLRAGHVLITSRFGEWSSAVDRLDLEVLSPAASIEFLVERTDGKRRIEANDAVMAAELAREMDGLPLALEQAAAFIAAKHESFAGYLTRWKAREEKVRKWHDPVRMKYPRSIAITWDASFDQLDWGSRALLNMLCWFAPDPIPVAVWQSPRAEVAIANGAKRLAPEKISLDNADAEEARTGLSRYGLIQWRSDRTAFSVHRLVQEVTREYLTETQAKKSLQDALDVLNDYLPSEPPPDDIRSWPRWKLLQEHVAALLIHADRLGLFGIGMPTTRLMSDLGILLNSKGFWNKAEPYYRRALAIDEQFYGGKHNNVAVHLNNLVQLLKTTNRLAEAEQLMRRGLAIEQQSYGAEHPRVAAYFTNLAALLHETDHLTEAEQLMRHALEIVEQSFGAKHPRVAVDLNNLAWLLKTTHRLSEAEQLMRRALAIDEQSYGAEHPKVAFRLSNLAALLHETRSLEEVESLIIRALAIDEQSYGAEHPMVATGLHDLAALLLETNRLTDAEPLIRRALTIDERSYGAKHPIVARDLINLGRLLNETNRVIEAESAMRRALAIDEQSYGAEHPNVARDLNILAHLLRTTNRLTEAEPLMRRALAIFENRLGNDHPNSVIARNNYQAMIEELE